MLCVFTIVKAQSNLVLNPGFEESRDTCFPGGLGGFGSGQVDDWSDPSSRSSDYFSPLSFDGTECTVLLGGTSPPLNVQGFEYPHSGYCHAGFLALGDSVTTFYEYIQASFRTSLLAGKSYGIECYVSLAEFYPSCFSDLGFYFSDTKVDTLMSFRLPFVPQYQNPPSNMITTRNGWQRITGNYTANGGEKYVCIGNFTPYALCHAYYCGDSAISTGQGVYLLVDDVAVYDTAQIDTIRLCANDSVMLGGAWRSSQGLYTDMIGGLPVKFYIEPRIYSANLTIIEKPFVYGDSVRVSLIQYPGPDSMSGIQCFLWIKNDTIINVPMYNIYGCDSTIQYKCGWHMGIGKNLNDQFSWSVYPNPTNDIIQVKLSINDPAKYSVTIIDVAGREALTHSLTNDKIDISALKSGMYFIKLINIKTGNVVGTEKFVKE